MILQMKTAGLFQLRLNLFVRNGSMKNKNKKIPCLIYSRIVGYFQPIQQWNNGKKSEFNNRKTYKIPPATNGEFNAKEIK